MILVRGEAWARLMLDTMTIRKMPFEFPENLDPVFMNNDHRLSFSLIAGSLLLPHLEPYLIRSMKAAESEVTDPIVLEGLKAFASQEGQHYQMHKKFNETIRLAGFPGLEALEKELSDDYKRFTKTKSLRFNLAYAEGFEAMTMNAVKHLMEPNGFGDNLPLFLQMIEWHFVEELEHRTVAFDVYDHVCGGYFYRLFVGIWAQWHYNNWMRRVVKYMLKTSPQVGAVEKDPAKRTPGSSALRLNTVRNLFPGLLRIYMPNYTPHDVEIAPGMQTLADKYSKMALEVS